MISLISVSYFKSLRVTKAACLIYVIQRLCWQDINTLHREIFSCTYLKVQIFSARIATNKTSKRSWSGSNFPPPKHSFLKNNQMQNKYLESNSFYAFTPCFLGGHTKTSFTVIWDGHEMSALLNKFSKS